MIVGPTGGGKTKIYKVLQKACSDLADQPNYSKVRVDCLNPKSITQDQLYGFNDPSTGEWQDGILAKIVLEASKDESPDLRWVMFDGPVDAIWIENMNTVLDDNKKLCLNSGQVIPLTPRMTMMFEVADLAVASPAAAWSAVHFQVLTRRTLQALERCVLRRPPRGSACATEPATQRPRRCNRFPARLHATHRRSPHAPPPSQKSR